VEIKNRTFSFDKIDRIILR